MRIGKIVGMDACGESLVVPQDCLQWCQAQDYGVMVGGDMAEVNLDWWNTRLDSHRIPVQLWGRNDDGSPVNRGKAFLSRDDINGSLPSDGPDDLCVLYRAAAWLKGHRYRGHTQRFVDVSGPVAGTIDLTRITTALRACRKQHPANLDDGPDRTWSGWPHAPGVGPTLMSLYCWAVHSGRSRPQLLDKHSLATLCRLGWLELPSLEHFTARSRYLRYCELLHELADQGQVPAELVEMWAC